jgi:hypothetical protein
MPHRIATLYIRITTRGRQELLLQARLRAHGSPQAPYAMVNRQPEHHPEGVYYIRIGTDGGKQRFESVGKDSYVAMDKLAEKERWLRESGARAPNNGPLRSFGIAWGCVRY